MSSTKINDKFEFPARLCLDEFLSADAPPESRASPNIYLLHSVLVHKGDVGGGHYHAYIRPNGSVGFDYQTFSAQAEATTRDAYDSSNGVHIDPNRDTSKDPNRGGTSSASSSSADGTNDRELNTSRGISTSEGKIELLEKQARHGQWYKFNDETVQKVRPMEAINHCFGRNVVNLAIESAYMLVYIRESNASEIMEKVIPRDIPPCLTVRLDAIDAQGAEEERKKLQAKSFRTIKYATEEHVRDFHGYRRDADFMPWEDMAEIKIMDGSTYMRLC